MSSKFILLVTFMDVAGNRRDLILKVLKQPSCVWRCLSKLTFCEAIAFKITLHIVYFKHGVRPKVTILLCCFRHGKRLLFVAHGVLVTYRKHGDGGVALFAFNLCLKELLV